MGKLSDILRDGQAESLQSAWNSTDAAAEFAPLPPGEYVARIVSGEVFTSKTNSTLGYKIGFKILEGNYTGRKLWHDVYFTPAALPMSKRDFAKIGITSLDQLDQPVPRGIRCAIKVARRKSDSGDEYNAVRSFTVIGIDPPETDAFAPTGDGSTQPAEGDSEAEADDPAATPAAAADIF